MTLPLYDPKDVIRVHDASFEYALRVQRAVGRQSERRTANSVAGAALMTLSHETICLHRATRELCGAGWAFAAPIMLRVMLETMCSVAVIANSLRPDVASFKYFYSYTKEDLSDPAVDPRRAAAETGANIETHLAQMTTDDRQLGKEYLQAPKAGNFWYNPEFAGPTAIIKEYAIAEVLDLYRMLSMAAHGGFLGMRVFRDDPDLLDVNPRKDLRATGFALVSSSRLLAEATRPRVVFEALRDGGYDDVMKMIQALKPIG